MELVRAQSAVVLRPSHTTTIYRTRSVPDLSLYSRYTPKWPYRYYKDWDLYDDYWYDRYYYYSPLYRSTFYPRRYYYDGYALNPYNTLTRLTTVDTIIIMTIIHAFVTHISILIATTIIHHLIATRFRRLIGIVLGDDIFFRRIHIQKYALEIYHDWKQAGTILLDFALQ
ncbi:unnamed protein product [Onchocerca ochengi]|uniref:Uncharacterized protein n=1 Tax=Onchocerca ochengi TaxID=42157 RepID=A0A182DYD4_ONCOC|nr:unnamed protein product [Onchocerca ochengi]